jgi:hypothetical protein
LIVARQLLEVFLRGAAQLEIPGHEGISLMIRHRRDERQPGRDGARKARPLWAARPDTGFRSRSGGLRGPILNGFGIPLSALPQTAAPSQEARKS